MVDVYLQNIRTIYQDMPLIIEKLGLDTKAAAYHELLLSRHMIHDPQKKEPLLLIAFYLVILLIVSLSLILIIHDAFAVSMDARVHQFGILSSIGATPGQIRTCLMQGAAALCAVPILLGSVIGVSFSFGTIQVINFLAADVAGRHMLFCVSSCGICSVYSDICFYCAGFRMAASEKDEQADTA